MVKLYILPTYYVKICKMCSLNRFEVTPVAFVPLLNADQNIILHMIQIGRTNARKLWGGGPLLRSSRLKTSICDEEKEEKRNLCFPLCSVFLAKSISFNLLAWWQWWQWKYGKNLNKYTLPRHKHISLSVDWKENFHTLHRHEHISLYLLTWGEEGEEFCHLMEVWVVRNIWQEWNYGFLQSRIKRNKFTSSLEKRERKIKNPSLSKLLFTWSVTRNFLENGASDVISGIVVTKNSDSLSWKFDTSCDPNKSKYKTTLFAAHTWTLFIWVVSVLTWSSYLVCKHKLLPKRTIICVL